MPAIDGRKIALTWTLADPYAGEWGLIHLMNDYRLAHSLPPLEILPGLIRAAAWKANDMILVWEAGHGISHTDTQDYDQDFTDTDGREFGQRLLEEGWYNQNAYLGENIGAGYPTARTMLKGWQDSPGHNALMLNEHMHYVGVAQDFTKDNVAMWVADFASLYDGGRDDTVAEVHNYYPLPDPVLIVPK